MKNEKQVTMKNRRQALSGACSVCGTKMFKMGGSSEGSIAAKQRLKVKAASKKPVGRTTKSRKSKTKVKSEIGSKKR
jgi:Domain of unknown function (DUF5679)